MFDYHVHTDFSNDCTTPARDMLNTALARGMTEIAITDHYDPGYTDKDFPFNLDMPPYHNMLSAVQKEYRNRLLVRKGIELGIQKTEITECQKTVTEYPYDFVIASFHMSNGQLLHTHEFFDGRQDVEIHRDFYIDMYECLKAFKDYSVVGHFNIIDRYMHIARPNGRLNPPETMEYVRELLKMIIADGKGIEVNTSSFRYKLPILTPAVEILKAYRELGGEIITLGSDAHTPFYLGDHFEYICQLLENLGMNYVCGFEKKVPIFHKISKILY